MKISKTRLFFLFALCLTAIFFVSLILTRGEVFLNVLHTLETDSFMDFFKLVKRTTDRDLYKTGSSYTPFSFLIFAFFRWLIPAPEQELALINQYETIKIHQMPMLGFLFFMIINIIVFLYLCYYSIKGSEIKKVLFSVLMLVSIPTIYEIERGNILILSFNFCFVFLLFYNSPNKYLREVSYICLAFSAAIKIYPAIFGLLLLKQKQFKESMRLCLYGIASFFIPFAFWGGIDSLPLFIRNNFSEIERLGESHKNFNISFKTAINFIQDLFKININVNLILVCILICSLVTFCLVKRKSTEILCLSVLLVGLPTTNYTYTAMFFIPAVVYILNDTTTDSFDCIYLFFLVLSLFALPINFYSDIDRRTFYWDNISPFTIQQMFSVLILICTINIKEIKDSVAKIKSLKKISGKTQ